VGTTHTARLWRLRGDWGCGVIIHAFDTLVDNLLSTQRNLSNGRLSIDPLESTFLSRSIFFPNLCLLDRRYHVPPDPGGGLVRMRIVPMIHRWDITETWTTQRAERK
jgi:hypothetical protein